MGAIILTLGAIQLPAASSYWNNPAGGSFSNPANWIGGVPGPSDTAYFTNSANYPVTWAAGATNAVVDVAGGVVTNALGSATWWITSQYLVGHNPGFETLVALLATGQSGDFRGVPPGGVAWLEIDGLAEPGAGVLKAFWSP